MPRTIIINTKTPIITKTQNPKKIFINVSKINSEAKQKIKFKIVKKDEEPHNYTPIYKNQTAKLISHEPVKLPSKLELETFFYQNNIYLIDKTTQYIFFPNDIQNKRYQPIGKIYDISSNRSSQQLPEKKIEWYLKFELDIPLNN